MENFKQNLEVSFSSVSMRKRFETAGRENRVTRWRKGGGELLPTVLKPNGECQAMLEGQTEGVVSVGENEK